ncbi:MAG: TolC family protein, partial [Desulfobulbaceae bacterium]|nr:TolC family protein [Desulfobulbaceae bacterium]
RDISSRIRESYHELLYLREAQRLAMANRDVLDQLRKAGETAAASSRASIVDVMKAQAQSGQVQYDVLLLEELTRTEQTRLNAIIDRNPDAPFGDLADLPLYPLRYSLEEIYQLAEMNLEEIKVASANVEKAQSLRDLARYQTWPQFKLGLSYGELNQARQVAVQAGLMLPIWIGKNSGRVEGAQADVDTMRAKQRLQINESRAEIRDTFFRLQNAERLVTLYQQDLLPQAVRSMQMADTWFSKGQGSFADYLETVGAWYNFQLALARSKADYGKYLTRLESLAGLSLTVRESSTGAIEGPSEGGQ